MALGCSKGAGATGGSKGRGADGPVPVSVGTVTQADIPVTVGTFGTVMPYASVAVRPQVGGTLAEAHVKEGQYVKAGDLLFVIDTALYESALGTAQAELEKDNAQAALAQAELGRAEELLKSRIGAPADYDKAKAAAAAAQADVAADKVAIKAAQLNLKLLPHHLAHRRTDRRAPHRLRQHRQGERRAHHTDKPGQAHRGRLLAAGAGPRARQGILRPEHA